MYSKNFKLVETSMKVTQGNYYECIDSKGWNGWFKEGKKYLSNKNNSLYSEIKSDVYVGCNEQFFKLIETNMEIIKGNWYECIDEKGWYGVFKLGSKYFSNRKGNLTSERLKNESLGNAKKDFKLVETNMEITKGNWYECVNAEGWKGIFEVGKRYYSTMDFYLNSGRIPFQISSTNPGKDFKLIENTPSHYGNSKGSLYKFCEEQKLNSYEFDLIKWEHGL